MNSLDNKDWFRSSRWNAEISAAFEAKLQRARSTSRAQYIRIQAGHLASQPDVDLHEIARRMFQRVIDEYGDSDAMQAKSACEQLGHSFLYDGMTSEAESALRETLRLVSESPIGGSGTTGVTDLTLAELLLAKGDIESIQEASTLLDEVEQTAESQGLLFRDTALRFLIARSRVAAALGDPRASQYARRALVIADETTASIPRHPDLGRPNATVEQRRELEQIAKAPK